MDSKEIEKKLNEGELLFCPECDLFFPDTEECEIICCTNPFMGPSDLDIDYMSRLVTENFNKFYNKNNPETGENI